MSGTSSGAGHLQAVPRRSCAGPGPAERRKGTVTALMERTGRQVHPDEVPDRDLRARSGTIESNARR